MAKVYYTIIKDNPEIAFVSNKPYWYKEVLINELHRYAKKYTDITCLTNFKGMVFIDYNMELPVSDLDTLCGYGLFNPDNII